MRVGSRELRGSCERGAKCGHSPHEKRHLFHPQHRAFRQILADPLSGIAAQPESIYFSATMPARKQTKISVKNTPLLAKLRSVTKLHTSPRIRAEKITALIVHAFEAEADLRTRKRRPLLPRTRVSISSRRLPQKTCPKPASISCINQPEIDDKLHGLIKLAREQGYLTFDDLYEALPDSANNPDEMETMKHRLRSMEIDIIELWEVDGYSPRNMAGDRSFDAAPPPHLSFKELSSIEDKLSIAQSPINSNLAIAEKLSEFTRKCIQSAEWIAKKFSSEPEFEWSCAVLPLCKGLENEIHERMICPLREAAKGWSLTDDCRDKDFSKVAKYCSGASKMPPEMGTFAWFLGTAINSKDRRERSQLLQIFFRLVAAMANQGWLLSATGLLAALNEVTQKFRNPAAHIETLSRKHYQECRDYLIGDKGVLWALLEATRQRQTVVEIS